MSPRLLSRSMAAASGLALASGLLVVAAQPTFAGPADAGQALGWSVPDTPGPTFSAALLSTPLAEVDSSGLNAIFLSASGQVFVHSGNEMYNPPSALASQTVIDVSLSTSGDVYVALNDAGEMTFWGQPGNATTPGEVDVSGLTQVSLGGGHAVGIKADGTVVAWGSNGSGEATVPPELRDPETSNVVKVTTGIEHSYALRANGSVVAWGGDGNKQVSDLPPALEEPDAVIDIEARSRGGLALLSDGTLASWGDKATSGRGSMYNLPPATLDGKTITQISAGADTNLAIDESGGIATWGNANSTPSNVPAGLDGRTLSAVSVDTNYAYAIQRKVMTISESAVTGTAKEGQTLTGTPASFSGGPEITYEWLADDDQIDGATGTTLELTKAEVGKRITFRTVATQDGDVLTSDSPKTAVVAANVAATKTKVNKVKVKHTKKGKKNGKATIKVKVTGKNKPTGKVKFVVKKGKKKVFTKTKKLNKKAVAKVKVKKLKKGKYKVVATYKGNATNKKSKANKKFRVK